MKALVTGAAGFIGSHVARHCLDLGMEVTAVDDLSGGFVDNVPAGCRWVQGDLVEPTFVNSLWQETTYDYVYHLAAYAAEGLSHFIRRYNYLTNLVASVNLLNASINKEVSCFVFTSSIAVYGTGQTPMSESMKPHPEDPYGISKYAMELDLESAKRQFGTDYIVFRPHNVYGEVQNIADKYRNVIGIFMNQCLCKEPMSVFGDGLQTRAFSYIDDVAPIIAKSPLTPAARNQIFNVGADISYSILDLATAVAEAMDAPRNIIHLPPRNEVVHAFSDHSKINAVFPLTRSPVLLEEGIAKMAAWVKSKGRAVPTSYGTVEISKNLPVSWL